MALSWNKGATTAGGLATSEFPGRHGRTAIQWAKGFLKEELLFRGGTALNKLHFPEPFRYSEDIDLVRTTRGPIKPILKHVRETLEPWLGGAAYQQSAVAPKLIFRAQAEDGGARALRLKIEISTWETDTYDEPRSMTYGVDNPWFTGRAEIPTYSREEMLAFQAARTTAATKGARPVRSCPCDCRV